MYWRYITHYTKKYKAVLLVEAFGSCVKLAFCIQSKPQWTATSSLVKAEFILRTPGAMLPLSYTLSLSGNWLSRGLLSHLTGNVVVVTEPCSQHGSPFSYRLQLQVISKCQGFVVKTFGITRATVIGLLSRDIWWHREKCLEVWNWRKASVSVGEVLTAGRNELSVLCGTY